jgi:hypothetical protein
VIWVAIDRRGRVIDARDLPDPATGIPRDWPCERLLSRCSEIDVCSGSWLRENAHVLRRLLMRPMFLPSRTRRASRRPLMQRLRNLETPRFLRFWRAAHVLAFVLPCVEPRMNWSRVWNGISKVFDPFTFSRRQGHSRRTPNVRCRWQKSLTECSLAHFERERRFGLRPNLGNRRLPERSRGPSYYRQRGYIRLSVPVCTAQLGPLAYGAQLCGKSFSCGSKAPRALCLLSE